jgi:hypothetical protein
LKETEEALKNMKGIEEIHPDTSASPLQQTPVLIFRFKYDG